MAKIEILEGKNIFRESTVKINVTEVEHHGRGILHTHSFFEMVYIKNGFSIHTCDNKSTVLTAGDLFLLKPGQAHSYLVAHHTHLYNCLFEFDALDEYAGEIKELPGFNHIFQDDAIPWECVRLELSERNEIIECLEKMKWERKIKNIAWELRLKSLLVEILVLYSRLYNTKTKSRSVDERLKYIYEALQFIESHVGEKFGVKDVADSCGISSDYLAKQFKNILGIAPIEYINNFKIVKTMGLLKDTNIPIADIAKQSGFGDISHFSRQFKQVVGSSPIAYRKSHK